MKLFYYKMYIGDFVIDIPACVAVVGAKFVYGIARKNLSVDQ